ncbi:MAG TPA: hypothetical protein PLG15_04195 [Candidatus Gastranaerophilaceae bacterium]|nr:hypothetical protein [Candidatus Gastranaerophilaceae bacterium]HPT41567.1 hypothetical protein [Candidatus Gastranaerophilaceae bacterium]
MKVHACPDKYKYPKNLPMQQKYRKFSNFSNINFSSKDILVKSTPVQKTQDFSWTNDPVILKSLDYLKNLNFDTENIKYVQAQGAILPFKSGAQAFEFINKSNTRIKFDTLSMPNTHAQYDFENNTIKINEIYKNTQATEEILAISEAILHETGHAKDGDGQNSVQEEINCLALNSVAHRDFVAKYSDIFQNSNAPIIKDGVIIYESLFFDFDPQKNNLITRLKEKYGFLPAGDFTHPPSELAFRVKRN